MEKKQKIDIRPANKEDLNKIKELIFYLMKVEKTRNAKHQTELIIKERVMPSLKKSSANKTFLTELKNKIIGLMIVEIKNKRVLSIAYYSDRPQVSKNRSR